MEVETWPLQEPALDRGRLVGAQVVEHQVQLELVGHLVVDAVEEVAELDGTMPAMQLADDLAGGDVEGGEQRGGAVPSVVVGLALGLARPHGQQRLAAVEGLDLRLLVDAEHQGAVGGVEVETDTQMEGICAYNTKGTAIWNNTVTGSNGADAIGLWNSSRDSVIGNKVNGFTVGPTGYAQI